MKTENVIASQNVITHKVPHNYWRKDAQAESPVTRSIINVEDNVMT